MTKNIKIDPEKCIGCGSCVAFAPGTFEMGDDMLAKVLDNISDDNEDVKSAIESCPTEAITLE